jgi:hypothetical protein
LDVKADSKRLREMGFAEEWECLAERRVWRLTFKGDINTGVIELSRCTFLLFERVVEKSSNAVR